MIGMIRPRTGPEISPKRWAATGISIDIIIGSVIGALALYSQTALAQSVFIPGAEAAETQQVPDAQTSVISPATMAVKCPGSSAGIDCGVNSSRQQAHVTLALLYLGIRDRCMDRACRLSVRSIGR